MSALETIVEELKTLPPKKWPWLGNTSISSNPPRTRGVAARWIALTVA